MTRGKFKSFLILLLAIVGMNILTACDLFKSSEEDADDKKPYIAWQTNFNQLGLPTLVEMGDQVELPEVYAIEEQNQVKAEVKVTFIVGSNEINIQIQQDSANKYFNVQNVGKYKVTYTATTDKNQLIKSFVITSKGDVYDPIINIGYNTLQGAQIEYYDKDIEIATNISRLTGIGKYNLNVNATCDTIQMFEHDITLEIKDEDMNGNISYFDPADIKIELEGTSVQTKGENCWLIKGLGNYKLNIIVTDQNDNRGEQSINFSTIQSVAPETPEEIQAKKATIKILNGTDLAQTAGDEVKFDITLVGTGQYTNVQYFVTWGSNKPGILENNTFRFSLAGTYVATITAQYTMGGIVYIDSPSVTVTVVASHPIMEWESDISTLTNRTVLIGERVNMPTIYATERGYQLEATPKIVFGNNQNIQLQQDATSKYFIASNVGTYKVSYTCSTAYNTISKSFNINCIGDVYTPTVTIATNQLQGAKILYDEQDIQITSTFTQVGGDIGRYILTFVGNTGSGEVFNYAINVSLKDKDMYQNTNYFTPFSYQIDLIGDNVNSLGENRWEILNEGNCELKLTISDSYKNITTKSLNFAFDKDVQVVPPEDIEAKKATISVSNGTELELVATGKVVFNISLQGTGVYNDIEYFISWGTNKPIAVDVNNYSYQFNNVGTYTATINATYTMDGIVYSDSPSVVVTIQVFAPEIEWQSGIDTILVDKNAVVGERIDLPKVYATENGVNIYAVPQVKFANTTNIEIYEDVTGKYFNTQNVGEYVVTYIVTSDYNAISKQFTVTCVGDSNPPTITIADNELQDSTIINYNSNIAVSVLFMQPNINNEGRYTLSVAINNGKETINHNIDVELQDTDASDITDYFTPSSYTFSLIGEGVVGVGTNSWVILNVGEYELKLTVRDSANNTASESITFNIQYSPELIAFNQLMERITKLEQLSAQYSSSNVGLRVLQYIRSERYTGTAWNIVAGTVESGFVTYVADNQGEYDLVGLKDKTKSITLISPTTGDKIDFGHMVALMNVALKGSLTNNTYNDLAGWGGDLCQFAVVLKNTGLTGTALQNKAYELFKTSASGFSIDDLLGDIDALNLIKLYNNSTNKSFATVMSDYYLNGAEATRNEEYLKLVFPTAINSSTGKVNVTQEEFANIAISRVNSNYLISMWCSSNGLNLTNDAEYVKAAAMAFAKHFM